jgi:hypothetical protein
MGGGDKGGKKACDPSGGQRQNGLMKPFGGETRAIEVHPCEPIHLGIKKTWAGVEVCLAKMKLSPAYAGGLPGKVVSLRIVPLDLRGHIPAKTRSLLIRGHLGDLSMLNDDIYRRFCSWNFPSNNHGGLSVGLYKITACFKIY